MRHIAHHELEDGLPAPFAPDLLRFRAGRPEGFIDELVIGIEPVDVSRCKRLHRGDGPARRLEDLQLVKKVCAARFDGGQICLEIIRSVDPGRSPVVAILVNRSQSERQLGIPGLFDPGEPFVIG